MTKRTPNTYDWVKVAYNNVNYGTTYHWIKNTDKFTVHIGDRVIFKGDGLWPGEVMRRTNHAPPVKEQFGGMILLAVTKQYPQNDEWVQPELSVVPDAVVLLDLANQLEILTKNIKGVLNNA